MKLPSVTHPKRFKIDGIEFEVVSYSSLTDEQASKVAMHFFRTHTFKRKDQGKVFRVETTFDQSTIKLL
jgi:hypothetical protein